MIESILASFKKSVRSSNIAVLASIGDEWINKLVKGQKGEAKIYQMLRADGYIIVPFEHLKEGSNISMQRKIEKAEKSLKFPDALALKVDEHNFVTEFFYLDAKFKSLSRFNGIVNVRDYDGYWDYHTIKTEVRVYFYLKDRNEIWFHKVRNPKKNPKFPVEFMRNNYVYRIFMSELELCEVSN